MIAVPPLARFREATFAAPTDRRTQMKTLILAAIAALTLGIGASTMAHAASNGGSPWQGHVSDNNGQG